MQERAGDSEHVVKLQFFDSLPLSLPAPARLESHSQPWPLRVSRRLFICFVCSVGRKTKTSTKRHGGTERAPQHNSTKTEHPSLFFSTPRYGTICNATLCRPSLPSRLSIFTRKTSFSWLVVRCSVPARHRYSHAHTQRQRGKTKQQSSRLFADHCLSDYTADLSRSRLT